MKSRNLVLSSWTPYILFPLLIHYEIWTNWLVRPLPAPHSVSLCNDMIHFGLIDKLSAWFFSLQPPTTVLLHIWCLCTCRQPHLAHFSVLTCIQSEHPDIHIFIWNMLNTRQKTQARRWKKQHFVLLNTEMKYKNHSPGEKSDKTFICQKKKYQPMHSEAQIIKDWENLLKLNIYWPRCSQQAL